MKYLFLIFIFLFFFVPNVKAEALVTITPNGEVYKNVLGDSVTAQTQSKLNDIVGVIVNKVANVVITQVDAKVQVALNNQFGTPTTAFDQNTTNGEAILEIQKTIPSEKVTIKKVNDQFGIEQENIVALTNLTVKVDPSSQDISLSSDSGERKLSVLPNSIVRTLVNSRILSAVQNNEMNVIETDSGELIYSVTGTRKINLFNLANIDVPVSATISATTGKVESVNQPTLLKVFGFLFS